MTLMQKIKGAYAMIQHMLLSLSVPPSQRKLGRKGKERTAAKSPLVGDIWK